MLPLEMATGFLAKSATGMTDSLFGAGGGSFTSPVKTSVKAVYKWVLRHLEGFGLEEMALAITVLLLGIALTFVCLIFITKNMRVMISGPLERAMNRALGRSGLIGDGATEDHIITYDDVSGLGSIPLVDSMNVTWGWPGDLIDVGGVIYGCDTFCEMMWTFDPSAGLVTPISASAGGPGWDTRLGSLAYDPAAELIYAFDWSGSHNDLFIFDPLSATRVGHRRAAWRCR